VAEAEQATHLRAQNECMLQQYRAPYRSRVGVAVLMATALIHSPMTRTESICQ